MRPMLPLLPLVAALSVPASAQDIAIRISFKVILDASGNPPAGGWADPAAIQAYVDETNATLARLGRGYGFEVAEVVEVGGIPAYHAITTSSDPAQDEILALEAAAEQDPATYHWSLTATNVYVPATINGGSSGGIAFVPSDSPGAEIVVLAAGSQPFDLLHEVGHHFDLRHTFQEDFVADTLYDPEATCDAPFSCDTGGDSECCCVTKLALLAAQGYAPEDEANLLYNVMSYFGATDCAGLLDPPFSMETILMTSGQLDRFTDATRLYHPGEVSGLTWFVDLGGQPAAGGWSFDPFDSVAAGVAAAHPAGGDVVLMRAGAYGAIGVYEKPLALRASGGSAVLGM